MSCRNCLELEQFLHSALEPDAPETLAGLSVAAIRNRTQQKQERITKLRADLERHKATCVASADASLATV